MNKNSRRIAKNTAMLYVRMLIVTVVALFTSRVVLNTLGVEDYGIYNIVGSVVTLFAILNTSLTNASQRYLTIAVGKNDAAKTQKVFSTILLCQIFLAILIIILAETVGLWFVNNKLNIPIERMHAARIAYHFSVLYTCVSILRVPYIASIIANERMDFYAYTSIVETILKLVIVYLLVIFDYDKMILYSFLQLSVAILVLIWYIIYSGHSFDNNKIILKYDKEYFNSIISFSGWNILGSTADVGYRQGTNILLNIFFGVALNAAMGIFMVVRTTVSSFVSNLQVAANPQITKQYTSGAHQAFENLVCTISKLSYFLMLLIALPFALNVSYILKLWLGEVPNYTADFLIIGMAFSLVDSLHGPLWTAVFAHGKINIYQIVTSILLLFNLPISYFALYLGFSPVIVLWIQVVISIITLVYRIYYASHVTGLSLRNYFKRVIVPVLLVTIFSMPIPIYASTINLSDIGKLLLTSVISVMTVLTSLYFLGLSLEERTKVIDIVNKRLCKN